MQVNLERLLLALRRCQMQLAVDLVAPWVERAVAGEIELLIDACPPALRPRLALLLGDLMGGWPRGVWGVPVLMMAGRCAETPAGARRVVLPGPAGERGVAAGVVFLGWLDKHTLLPAQGLLAGRGTLAEVSVAVGRVDAAIAVFRADEGVDAGLISIPPLWWAEVMMAGMPVELRVSAGGVAEGYAGALEVARAMWRAAGGEGVGAGEVFSTRGEMRAGIELGRVFAGARMS